MSKEQKFVATNVEDITKKPAPVQALWRLLSKMDPKGELFVNDVGIIAVAGEVAQNNKNRTPEKLKLSAEEKEWVNNFAVYDSDDEPDSAESATGLLFTAYQIIEMAFSMGTQWEAARVTRAVTKAADEEAPDDEAFDEEEKEEDLAEGMDEVSEDSEEDDDDDDE